MLGSSDGWVAEAELAVRRGRQELASRSGEVA